MRSRRGTKRRNWTAGLAAFVVAVEAFVLAFASGAGAAPVQRDLFGNVVCASGSDGAHRTGSDPADGDGSGLDCCTAAVASPLGAAGSFPPPSNDDSPARQPVFFLRLVFALHPAEDASGVPASPRAARAPPAPAA